LYINEWLVRTVPTQQTATIIPGAEIILAGFRIPLLAGEEDLLARRIHASVPLGQDVAVGHVIVRGVNDGLLGHAVLLELQLGPGGAEMIQQQEARFVGGGILDFQAAVQLADEVLALVEIEAGVAFEVHFAVDVPRLEAPLAVGVVEVALMKQRCGVSP